MLRGRQDQPECEKKRWHLGTYKTLETSLSAMQTLGALGGALTYFASEYLWKTASGFSQTVICGSEHFKSDRRKRRLKNLELHDLAQLRVRNLRG